MARGDVPQAPAILAIIGGVRYFVDGRTPECDPCGSPLRPAPARADGEPTYVGYWRCTCLLDEVSHGE
jgi:hypothetical protein